MSRRDRERRHGLAPLPENASAQQREARIAELRALRRRRQRRLAVRAGLGTLALALVAALALSWLLLTIGGRDLLLRQIVARLPAGTTLDWTRAQGPAAGPLTLHGVRFSMPRQLDADCVPSAAASCAMGRISFSARAIVLDPALRPLLGRRLRLDALVVRDATLDLPRSDTPFAWPRWPQSLPDIAPPLALQADAIRIDRLAVTRAAQPLLAIRSARGGLDASAGQLHVEHLVVDSDRGRFGAHGDYAPRDDYRSDFTLTAALPAPAGRTPPRLGVVARGDLARLLVAVSGHAPAPLDALLTLTDDSGGERPQWTLRAGSAALDPGLLSGTGVPATPIAFDLRARGSGGAARLQGSLARGAFTATLQPSRVRLHDQVLQLQPLVVDLLDGRVIARGHLDLRPPTGAGPAPQSRLALNARHLRWLGNTAGTPAVVANADFGIAGTPDRWAAIGKATFQRGTQRAQLDFDGRGTRAQIRVRQLHATMPTGTLEATGHLRWSPALAWDGAATLAGFDPGYFLPDWDGAVDGRLASTGETRSNGDLDARLDVQRLGGRLRGRALGGHGRVALLRPANDAAATRYEGDIALALGASRVSARGTIADTLDVHAAFAPLQLGDLLPDAAGTLHGTLALGGARTAPDVAADLDGRGLRYRRWQADTLRAQGRLPWRHGSGALVLDARGLEAGVVFDRLHVDARGAVEQLQLEANARSEFGSLALAGSAARGHGPSSRGRARPWQGTLDRLRLQPVKGGAWQLQAPARFAQSGNGWTLGRSCLAAVDGGSLCASGQWPRQGLDIAGQSLPLALATPWLPVRDDGRPWLLHGEIALAAHLRAAGNGWRGTARLASAAGGLQSSARAGDDLVDYRNLVLDAQLDPQRVQATLDATLDGDGRIHARLASGWDAYAPLSATVALDTEELTWMELLSPDIVAPRGQLVGQVTVAGSRTQPVLGGSAQLSGFSAEIPALAIAPGDGNLRLDARADGSARIAGSLRSGDGILDIDGTLGWRDDDTPLLLNVRGKNVLASDTRDLRAVIDPDVTVRYAARQPLDIRGSVGVPSARIDLERLDRGVSTSPDVVILDPADPEDGLATPLQLDLTLALGEDVRLHGFGLDGSLDGSLRVRARPGRETLASGTLEVGGRYTAYGQKLAIRRGRLLWQGGPIADPLLDIRAERDLGDVTAGIDVSGRASRPQAEVWTDPASDQSQALAWLALGRPLSTATGDESRRLDAASAALSAGGSLLASQLGASLGLDDAGVSQSRALGGSVLGVGKYLSPKLYVGYGVSLLGTGQVLTLKYLLRKGFDIEIESSTAENRASVNWRTER
ncbi:translocation/assembly module TamB domain-containing protein [Cognatiluteimonas weifangensis]|uniref:translocation/assembly module TamB domain-containing protein n=1 Tax=Cognatiluteimonas weifangensis TaxID=2303539 RepID=UPI001F2161BF|nr:translocation/assembly module TamB domain-containing protein [Luteimonas weifangensis]